VLRFLTAGESHGPGLTVIVEGLPPGIPVSIEDMAREQSRRRWCYGRGGRASIERDEIEVTAGLYEGKTVGAPIAVWIPNRDYPNWAGQSRPIWVPRPGHADLAGASKYGFIDMRPVAERASARETAARVACGYLAKCLLRQVGASVVSWVAAIGDVTADLPPAAERMRNQAIAKALADAAEGSPVRCPDAVAERAMIQAIDQARAQGDSLGGRFEVAALGVQAGLGSYVHWDRRLDTAIAGGLMSINGVKGVEIGGGFELAAVPGSRVHDEIYSDACGCTAISRPSNNAGGIEGGVSNGEMIFARAAHKPIPMLGTPLQSIDLRTGQSAKAHRERSDVCAVGSAAVVAESMVAIALANAWLARHGQDAVLGVAYEFASEGVPRGGTSS